MRFDYFNCGVGRWPLGLELTTVIFLQFFFSILANFCTTIMDESLTILEAKFEKLIEEERQPLENELILQITEETQYSNKFVSFVINSISHHYSDKRYLLHIVSKYMFGWIKFNKMLLGQICSRRNKKCWY